MRPLIGSFLSFLVLCGFVFSFQLDFDVVPTKEQIIDLKIEYIKNLSKFVIISLNKKDKTEWYVYPINISILRTLFFF